MNRSDPSADAAATYSLRQVLAAAALVSAAAVGAVVAATNPLVALGAAVFTVGAHRARRLVRRRSERSRRACAPQTAARPES